jgi:hypothetical protein
MTNKYYKYPRTPHLPWSQGVSSDDISLLSLDHWQDREVVVTEKLDGENTTMYSDHIHARSLDSKHHQSRDWVKGLHGQIRHLIPQGWRLCGENMYAQHSIAYEDLRSYFYVFSIWDEANYCLNWDETLEWTELLDLVTPPILYRGVWSEKEIQALSFDPQLCEGYVVRSVAGFAYEDFALNVAKSVRAQHVQTDVHWMYSEVIPNRLSEKDQNH